MKITLKLVPMVALITLSMTNTSAIAQDSTVKPTPAIYDTLANTRTQISEALMLAKETDRRVLLQWGANWCSWCRLLHATLETDSLVNRALNEHYVWVMADVGRKDKNGDLLEKYGVNTKAGIPFLTVLDTAGTVVVNQETGSLETNDKDHPGHDHDKLMAFLTAHASK